MGFGRLFRRLVHLPHRDDRAVARDIDDEIAFHLDMRVRELMARGASASDARARAKREFGNVGEARRILSAEDRGLERERRRAQWLRDLAHDVRFSIRQLRRTPTFTIVSVLTLALGIGATTAIMSVVRGVLLRPLPFRSPEGLVRVYASSPKTARGSLSVADFLDFQSGTGRTLSAMASYYTSTTNLTGNGDPERLDIAKVDANWFALLGVRPLLGRTFRAGEDAEGAKRVTVMGESLWRRLYGSDRDIVGRAVTLDGNPVEVVGVVPDGGRLPAGMELWAPTRYTAEERSPSQRGAHWLGAIARLREGATLAQANGDLVRIARQLELQDPKHNTQQSARAVPLEESLFSDVERPLYILLGAVGLVLVIACINVAGLLLARTAARATEIAVRTAIGAGRGRIVRQLLTESLVLSLVGAAFGFTLAVAGTRLLVRAAPADTPRLDQVHLDSTMFAFTLALATLTGLIFGLVPALHAASRELQSRLKDSSRSAAGKLGSGRLRRALVIAELALSIMLLAGAGLLLRSFAQLQHVDPGFETRGRTMFTVVLPEKSYPTLQSQRQFLSAALERVGAVPGVRSVAATFGLPLSDTRFSLTFSVEGRPAPAPQDEPQGQVRVATADYFKTMSIPLIRGRTFTVQDRLETPQVMVVSQELVRRYFPNEDPIGKRIGAGWRRDGRRLGGEIVGVVGDVKQFGLKDDAPPMYYAAADQWPTDEIVFVADATSPPQVLIPALRTAIRGIDRDLPLFDVRTVDALVAGALAQPRFYLGLLGGFAAVSLVLAGVGVYGVIAYSVRQRTREIGVRMALGATSARILRMVVGEGLILTAVGIGLGICGALLLTGELKTLLYNVEPNDRATLVLVSALLTAVAVAACLVPARVAARVDPQGALRGE